MTPTCCAYGCLNKFKKGSGLGFYRFPSRKNRRTLWTLAVRRKHFTPNKHTRICGAHFVTGKPSKNAKHVDYVPSIFKFKFSRHESRRFRKVLCDLDDVQDDVDVDTSSELSDGFEVDHVLDQEPQPQIKIESEINLPSEIEIAHVQSILDDDEVYNAQAEAAIPQQDPVSYTFLDLKGNVIARFVKKVVVEKKSSYRSRPRRRQIDPDSVRIIIEDNIAKIVAD